MGILSSIFSDDSESSLLNVVDLNGSANLSRESESYDRENDNGEITEEYSYDRDDTSLDFDLSNLIFNQQDSESDGGGFAGL